MIEDPKEPGYTAEIPEDAIAEALRSVEQRDPPPPPAGARPAPEVELEFEVEADPAPEQKTAAAARQAEEESYREKFLRAVADLDNFRKRVAKEKEEWRLYGHEQFARELVGVADNFELAVKHAPESPESKAVLEGVRLIYKQFLDVLAKAGVQPFAAKDGMFNPERHEIL